MAPPYDVNTYLLDKTYLNDVIACVALGFDGDHELLRSRVYPPQISLNYKNILGNEPRTMAVDEWTECLTEIHAPYQHLQHVFSNLHVDLPPPSATSERPLLVTGKAYAHGYFYNDDAEGRPRKMARRNGGRHQLEFIRDEAAERRGENPWRISKHVVTLDWQDIGGE